MFESASASAQPLTGWSEEAFAPLRTSLENGQLLLELLRDEQQAIGYAQAWRARWLVDFCRSRPATDDRPDTEVGAAAAATRAARPAVLSTVSEWAVDEVATALSITAARAQTWMVQSLQLVDLLPATLLALEHGHLTWEHATVLGDVLAHLDDQLRAEAEARLLARLGHKTPTQLRAAAHRVVQRLDGQAISRRVEAALRERGVAVHPTGDGLGTLSVTNLPLPVLRAVEDALRQYADAASSPDDCRTRQQRMVDCLVDLILRPGDHGLAPVQAQLTVLATVRTLLGGDDPGEISGDVVPAEMVRALARALGLLPDGHAAAEPGSNGREDADAEEDVEEDAEEVLTGAGEGGAGAGAGDEGRAGDLTDLLATRSLSGTSLAHRSQIALVDELTGQLLALTDATGLRAGRSLGPPPPIRSYRPTNALRRHVQLRDRRCRFPGCRRPGQRCDLHHVVRFPEGATSAENLCCLCRHHHRLVHQAPGWELHALPRGALRFTTPTGQVLTTWPSGFNDDADRPHQPGRTGAPRGAPPGDDPPPF
ncbi:HNH endonuclease signature motif containing protein [Modestobacter sp. VKM Ac-2985]|uniref:HNH endonuclease signature motif containing protein n=1 Tax=Modestobacter sp. VKM Ac-2985 TaxID=3004139 RepID=UPI0022AB9324|nr:HNH endonuclease signature motif containing protein [Modestobacter sp. VKM Ac-2985]MCZ2839385.1 DUF222 domain-containing protein [Modestobacter sp. VKM Ac-2985]